MSTATPTRRRAPSHRSHAGARGSARAGIDPRLDARRRAVRRRHSRRRTVVLVVLAVVTLAAAGAWPLLHSRLFSATVLRVEGNVHTPAASVLSAAGLAGHPPLIDVDAAAAARRVEALPWVASARVALQWPDGVTVTVSERRAVATASEGGGRWAVLDDTGRVLAVVRGAPAGLVPLVSAGHPGAPGTVLAGAAPSLRVAAALPVAFRSLVSAVAPSPGGGVDLSLSDGVGVVFGAATELPSKFEDVASLLAGASLAPGSVIDVSVPNSPVVSDESPSRQGA